MGALAKLLNKWGFVKLDRYGLVLTPEDRILATRPTILDDGVGGRVVGWQQHDLAFSELQAWMPGETNARREIVPPAPLVRALSRPAPPPPQQPKAQAAPAPIPAPPAPKPIPQPIVQVAPAVAPQPPVEEDEWEWEIAVARARAQELDDQAQAEQEEEDTWAVPTPVHGSQILAQESAPAPVQRTTHATLQPVPSAPRSTVIPVPALPVSDPALVRASITQTRTYAPPPRRFPRATDAPKKEWRATLPPAATTIGLPSARRVAAKTR